jgi:hypothetical protein
MNEFCQDRDLLALEPAIFLGAGFPTQQLAGGANGVLTGTTFASTGSNFTSAGVQAGMVLTVYDAAAAEGNAFEIVAVNSATTLTVSVLRADVSLPATSPKTAGASFYVRTFRPQILNVSETLAEKLIMLSEVFGVEKAEFANSRQLRMTAAYGTLSSVYVARAASATDDDANWLKAEHYRQEFIRLQSQLRVTSDTNGDGQNEQTRTLGNVLLRRV